MLGASLTTARTSRTDKLAGELSGVCYFQDGSRSSCFVIVMRPRKSCQLNYLAGVGGGIRNSSSTGNSRTSRGGYL